MQLTVVIPTLNRQGILDQTVRRAVEAASDLDAEVLVVNDSKTTIDLARPISGRVKVLENPKSGAASARNLGARAAKGELLLFLDDDILIDRIHLEAALAFLKDHGRAGLNLNWRYPDSLIEEMRRHQIGRFLIDLGQTDYKGWVAHGNWSEQRPFEVDKLATFFLLMPKAVFEAVGGFDESFTRAGIEDDEFSRRLKRIGVGMFIDPTLSVLHNSRDRMTLEAQVRRMKAGAVNRRRAYEMGMKDLAMAYPRSRVILYSILRAGKPLIARLAELTPNRTAYDGFFRRLARLLFGIGLFEGYYLRDESP